MHPFTKHKIDSVAHYGEVKLLKKIKQWLGKATPEAPQGIGDDCAVFSIEPLPHHLITTDSLVYGYHFDDKIGPIAAGAKLLKRSLSDIAAMGGTPDIAVVTLMLPGHTSIHWLASFYAGLKKTAIEYKVSIVGGDLSESKTDLVAVLTLTGHAAQPLTRTGAQIGNEIWVTGTLGGSITEKQYAFSPRLKEGQWLAQKNEVTAMMDLTDGLTKDLLELTPCGCGAELDIEALPISKAALLLSQKSDKTPQEHALSDGEDYELLFTTIPLPESEKTFIAQWKKDYSLPLTKIGTIQKKETQATGVIWDHTTHQPISNHKGFEHFNQATE